MIQSSEKIGLSVIIIIAVCLSVAATHRQALSAKALSFDDQQYLTKNVLVQNPGWASAKRFLTEVRKPSTVEGYYQPLTMISLMLDYAAGGRKDNLRPFHVTSLALHTANTALIIILLYLLFGNIWAAAAVGLLFGVHPMTVEPIPWVGERKTLLAAFFAFCSLLFYIRFTRANSKKSYAACLLMYLLALMSKPTSISLPAVMLLMDYWPLKRLNVKRVVEKIPLLILGAVFAVITYVSQSSAAPPVKIGLLNSLLVLCHNIIFYLYKIILPVNLSFHYTFPKPLGLSNPMVLSGVIGTCILIPVLLISLRWTRAALTGWLIFFTAIFPAMGVARFTVVVASDKFAYLPCVGLLMILASFLIWFCRSNKARIVTAIIVLILAGAEATAAHRYLRYWKDDITLAKHMVSLSPDSAEVYTYLGAAYEKTGRIPEATEAYKQAIRIDPYMAQAHYNLGVIYGKSGRTEEAIEAYTQVIKIEPDYTDAYYNLGMAYSKLGRYEEAIQAFKEVTRINPNHVEVYNNLGAAYNQLGLCEEAIQACKQAIKLKPNYAEAYNNLGAALLKLGRYEEVIEVSKQAAKIIPNDPMVHNNLGVAFYKLGRYPEAIDSYRQAIRFKSDYASAHYNLGLTFSKTGDANSVMEEYRILKTLDAERANKLLNAIQK